MKANEAPEKIYVNFHFTETHPGRSPMVTKQGINKYDVVYVRTDAFIEKATEWLKKNVTYTHPRKGTEECVINLNAFIEAMKGE